jgi:hypothetical protein
MTTNTESPTLKSVLPGRASSKQRCNNNIRQIIRPLMTFASVAGLSVWHMDKRVMRMKIAYFVFASIVLLVTPAVCIHDMMNVPNV